MYSNRFRAYSYLISTAAIWGAAGPVIKFTLGGIDPLPFLAYRFFIASFFSIAFFAYKVKKGKKFKKLRAQLSLSILYGFLAVPVGLGILFFGLDNSTVLDLTLIGVISPLLVTLGSSIFFHDHITKREKIGTGIILAGIFVNSFLPILHSFSDIKLTGNILLLIFLLSDSSSILIAKRLVRFKIKSANLTNLAFIVGAIVLIPLALFVYGFDELIRIITTLPLKYHLGVWYMALVSGTLAYYLYVRAQKTIEVSEAALFHYLQPIFMVPLAVFWLGEKITNSMMIGAFIITIGLVIAEFKKKSYNNPHES